MQLLHQARQATAASTATLPQPVPTSTDGEPPLLEIQVSDETALFTRWLRLEHWVSVCVLLTSLCDCVFLLEMIGVEFVL